MSVYKVVMNGGAHGVQISNLLYYRTGPGIDMAGFALGGCETVAQKVKEVVWPKMKAVLPSTYKLENITVYDYDNGNFELIHQNPFTLNVLENGSSTAQTDGTAQCIIMKFNLEPSAFLFNGYRPPKRGYVAIGPIASDFISDTGHITDAIFANMTHAINQLAVALSQNLDSLVPPVIFYPVRVKTDRVAGIIRLVSWADISSAAPRRLTSYRRSRMAER